MTVQQVVLLAGGTGERFKGVSDQAKPLIEIFGSSQIVWALKGARLSYPGSQFFIAARSGLAKEIEKSVESSFPGLVTEYVDVGDSTSGAAETLYRFLQSSERVDMLSPLVSCDNDCFNLIRESYTGNFLTTVHSTNPGHCFILSDGNSYALELHEKSLVSTVAISGNYGFAQAKIFMDYYLESNYQDKERFISSVISEMLLNGEKFKLQNVAEYFSLGTPEEISNLDKRILKYL